MQNQFSNIQGQLNNMEARQINLSVSRTSSAIRPLLGNAGDLPVLANMPQTKEDLIGLTAREVDTLATFYNIDNASIATKKDRLLEFWESESSRSGTRQKAKT